VAARKGTRVPNAPRGRPAGTHNLVTRSAKEAFEFAFKGLGGAPGLLAWAKKNQRNRTEFYKIFAKHFLPTTLNVEATPAPLPDVVLTVEQATEVYRRVMGDPSLDIGQIEFAPQAPRQAALEPLEAPIGAPPTDALFTVVPEAADTTVQADRSNVVELSDKAKLWAKLAQ
jgi:hypothetical protein